MTASVVALSEIAFAPLSALLAQHGLALALVGPGEIPGSYWGEREAGLIGHTLYARLDTPVHSILHEACHYICMDTARRDTLHTDARGDDVEEVAVCYLQALLADRVKDYSRERLFADMDAWGYTYRLGSTRAWFEHDAEDARDWLRSHRLIDASDQPLLHRREH